MRSKARTMIGLFAGSLLLVLFAAVSPASAQTPTACANPARTGIEPNLACASGCCATIVPSRNSLHIGAGLCVDPSLCGLPAPTTLVACSTGPTLSLTCSNKCPVSTANCCLTVLHNVLGVGSGLCLPDAFCGSCP